MCVCVCVAGGGGGGGGEGVYKTNRDFSTAAFLYLEAVFSLKNVSHIKISSSTSGKLQKRACMRARCSLLVVFSESCLAL